MIDTAQFYRNQVDVGAAIRTSGIPRHEIFVQTKCSGPLGFAGTLYCIDDNLMMLGLQYVDLLLIHWPTRIRPECLLGNGDSLCSGAVEANQFPEHDMVDPGYDVRRDSWKALELAVKLGKVRAIGVSNFAPREIEDLLRNATIVPAVLQTMWNPLLHDDSIRDFCAERGIRLQAWNALRYGILSHPVVVQISCEHHVSSSQIILRWLFQHGIAAVVGTSNPQHMSENMDIDFKLSDNEMTRIDELNTWSSRRVVQHLVWRQHDVLSQFTRVICFSAFVAQGYMQTSKRVLV